MTVQPFTFADIDDVWTMQEMSKRPVGVCNLKNNTSDPTLLETFSTDTNTEDRTTLINFALFTVSGIIVIFILDQFTKLGMQIRSKIE